MESSRIFVRGLPPNLSSEEFQKHFSKVSPTTDAKLFALRRIGYVGYKSHDEARKAVKYFNKSYIRMSRIEVELAKPALSLSSRRASDKEQAGATLTTESKESLAKQKRKHDAIDEENNSALVPLGIKTDANSKLVKDNQGIIENSDASKRRRNSLDSSLKTSDDVLNAQNARPDSDDDGAVENSPTVSVDNEVIVDPVVPEGIEEPPASDADWVRSRTSRLLGLLDDDEVQEPPSKMVIQEDQNLSDDKDTLSQVSMKVPEPDSQVDHEAPQTVAVQSENIANEDLTPQYRRIFIRNLAYDVTELDLREHFGKYGPLEEVSFVKNISYLFLLHLGKSPQKMNIQIGTSYASPSVANDVTWITVF